HTSSIICILNTTRSPFLKSNRRTKSRTRNISTPTSAARLASGTSRINHRPMDKHLFNVPRAIER
ncbi:hypothetical protein OF83DRAFT_1160725, partial [Amylostereum chailletii]